MKSILFYIVLCIGLLTNAQHNLEKVLSKYNSETVPYISVSELNKVMDEVIILDARELNEFNTSHIKNAIHVGYDSFNINETKKHLKKKGEIIVVYCSIGVRSEDIGEKLKSEGYLNVHNLFGGIFEWKNNGHNVYNTNNEITENIHAYSKQWSKWLLKGNKIYD